MCWCPQVSIYKSQAAALAANAAKGVKLVVVANPGVCLLGACSYLSVGAKWV